MQNFPLIETVYDFFDNDKYHFLKMYCKKCPYYWGEQDDYDTPFTGMVNNIYQRHDILDPSINEVSESISDYAIYSIIADTINEKLEKYVKNLTLSRIVVNCFAPLENPFYHTDFDNSGSITILIYMNDDVKLNDGGETQFLTTNNRCIGILPIPNSACCFDSTIKHRATSFVNQFRFTIAAKYTPL